MVYTNYGIDHYQNGHLWAFAALVMASLTGNIGVKGAGFVGNYVMYMPLNYKGAFYTNGKAATSKFRKPFSPGCERSGPGRQALSYQGDADILFKFHEQHGPAECMVYGYSANLDFHVVIDFELTDTARYADIVLPAAFWMEVDDLRVSYNNPYMMMQEKAIEPLYESKPPVEIFGMIARKMGLEKFFPQGVDDTYWVKMMLDTDALRKMNVTYDRLKAEKAVRVQGTSEKPYIRGEKYF
jgi:molybdopterin-containing oxidoreductase family molybdopterin binding subunit